MKPIKLFFISLLILFSCNKDDEVALKEFSEAINFNISEWVLRGENITCVDFDKDGNAWIASGSNLIFYDGLNTKSFSAGTVILDVCVSPDGRVWLGTKEKGLARFSKGEFTFFTSENSGLPRDYVHEVEVAPNRKVWFSSSAHKLGGLMCYDHGTFSLYTPENSMLNQNIIQNLKVDKDSRVYFVTLGTVGSAAVFRIDNQNNWKQLNEEISFYWISALNLTSDFEPVITTDHSLSSCMGCYENEVCLYQHGKWQIIKSDFEVGFFNRMFVDKRDYIWVQGSKQGDYTSYFVYDGQNWHRSAEGQIPEVFIKSVKVDERNNIWFCTDEGIFILRQ
jgi:ligand-binding sensor domain-containing protein